MNPLVVWIALGAAITAFVRAFLDHITMRTKLREYHARAHKAEHLLKFRGLLASQVAHDIKNPLTAIQCSAEALDLLIGSGLNPAHRKTLRYICDYSDHLLRLVGNFIDISRTETGNMERRPQAVNIAELIESVLGLLQAFAQKRDISLNLVMVRDDIFVQVDPTHAKQIFFNLLHNAIKFNYDKGEVTVVIKRDFPLETVSIEVSDTGMGISEEALPNIFDPYSQFHDRADTPEIGLGLGLALTKLLLDLEGGSIAVRSKCKVGTTFICTLPAADSKEIEVREREVQAHDAQQDTTISSHPLSGQRFLLVDSDSGAREAVARLIEAWGGIVDGVDAAVAAVEAIHSATYDAVMISNGSDGLPDYELARMVRGDLDGQETKIIVAGSNPQHEPLARQAGADQWIDKPLKGELLLDSLLRSGKYISPH